MTRRRFKPASALIAAVALAAGGCKTQYVDRAGGDLAVSPDRLNVQDWTDLAQRLAQRVVDSGVLDRFGHPSAPASVLLGSLQDETGEGIDSAAITNLVRTRFLETGRVQFITGESVAGAAEDPLVAASRKRRTLAAGLEDPLEGVPDLTGRLRLFRDRVRVGDEAQSSYFLQLTLSDVASQRSVWEGEVSVIKRGSRTTVGNR